MMQAIIAAAALLAAAEDAAPAAPAPSRGVRVDDLLASGFVVVRDTKVVGDFDGCERARAVPLAAGGVFTCSGFGYMHASNPKAVLLKSPDGRQFKLVVGNAVFDGAYA
ncbi:MAG: hypothetical protein ACXWK0_04505 [Caulobacteraceae bacterium]